MGFTDEQKRAIELRNGNLLVSAAAGSGKTSVLVERIIRRITDPDNPVNVDSIVVVTFTRAAANEMKKRLSDRLQRMLEEQPDNRYLVKQLTLLDNARITTIDSFCSYIISNYYNSIGIDPRFRVADEGEIKLIDSDVMDRIFEEHFESEDEDFIKLADCYTSGKKMDGLSDMIKQLETFAQSHPWPEIWLDECEAVYDVDSQEEYERLPAVQNILEYIRKIVSESADECDRLIDICNEPGGPQEYVRALLDDREMFLQAVNVHTLGEMAEKLEQSFTRLASYKGNNKEISDKVKSIRTEYKDRINSVKKKYLVNVPDQYKMMKQCRPYIKTIIGLTREFIKRKDEVKQSKNIMDFNDIEHNALRILTERGKDGSISYTPAADELSEKFEEIYIDEYQDSNLVQEYILNAVSKERSGRPDMFMVGDVKQSIYSFRMARPELFTDKYTRYKDSGSNVRIELHKNFRSRENVLDCVNDVFFHSMKKQVGGIDYTDDVKLNPRDEPFEEGVDDTTEIIVINKDDIPEDEDIENAEVCARIVAKRINEMKAENPELNYRDFVILIRSAKKSGPVYVSVLEKNGIPAVFDSSTGYFSAYEVQTVMEFLKVIDNPRQEIPLAGVMHSYFACFTAGEMADVKGEDRNEQLWDCLCRHADYEDELGKKCRRLVEMIDAYRDKASVLPVRELVSDIIYSTGFYDYIGSMRNGSRKQGNLKMLIERAGDYEKTSYSGLFNFMRYIEKLRKYEVDFGESKTISDADDVVRIMSIHHSKGLEFPIVIIGDMGHGYNEQNLRQKLVYNADYGLGITYVDPERRTSHKIPYKDMVAARIHNDSIGEELRILYVAMTRAIDKLIMIGVSDRKHMEEECQAVSLNEGLSVAYVSESKNYMDIVLPIASELACKGKFTISEIKGEELVRMGDDMAVKRVNILKDRMDELSDMTIDANEREVIYKTLEYSYPYDNVRSLRTKYSVSDLKIKAMDDNEELEEKVVEPERVKPVPGFLQSNDEISGTYRGTAYHKVFELIDYSCFENETDVKAQIDGWVKEGIMGKDMAELIDCRKFGNFIETGLGQAMKKAAQNNLLFREQPFTMEVKASEIDDTYPDTEGVLIQGIIDAFYIEDDKVYVVDYKTDRVPDGAGGEDILVQRYMKQLELYCQAIRQVTGRKIGGCYIYSVCLDRKVEIPFRK